MEWKEKKQWNVFKIRYVGSYLMRYYRTYRKLKYLMEYIFRNKTWYTARRLNCYTTLCAVKIINE